MLLTAGYWPTTYFPESYWNDQYWAHFGISVAEYSATFINYNGLSLMTFSAGR